MGIIRIYHIFPVKNGRSLSQRRVQCCSSLSVRRTARLISIVLLHCYGFKSFVSRIIYLCYIYIYIYIYIYAYVCPYVAVLTHVCVHVPTISGYLVKTSMSIDHRY